MSTKLTDSNSEGYEWTWVTSDGQIQDGIEHEERQEIGDVDEENEINDALLDSSESSSNDSISSSDIEKLDELPSKQPEAYPVTSRLNLAIKHDDDEGGDRENGVNGEIVDVEPMRSYVHTPNERVNLSLNIVMALALALVLGLGLGHFIGWSGRWIQRHHGQQRQVDKLKLLQAELSSCLAADKTSSSAACDRKLEYWKRQFEELLFKNEDLQRILDYGRSAECEAQHDVDAEKEKLKLSLFYRQLEHAETLKQFELIQLDERTHRRKLTALEEENEKLKSQLHAETKDDEKFLNFLMKENTELRLTMQSMQPGDETAPADDDSIIRVEMGSLREQINALHSENEDLRQVIARLRYGRPIDLHPSADNQNALNDLQTENGELKLEISKIRYGGDGEKNGEKISELREKIVEMRAAIHEEKNQTDTWKRLYEQSRAEHNVTKAARQLLDAVQTTADEVLRAVESNAARVVHVVQAAVNKSGGENWSEKMWSGINDSTRFVSARLADKWTAMRKLVSRTADSVSDAVRAVNVAETQQRAEEMVGGIVGAFWEVVDDLNRRWEAERGTGEKEKEEAKGSKKARAGKRKRRMAQARADWVFDRARDREKQRRLAPRSRNGRSEHENWYLKKKNYRLNKRGCVGATKGDWPSNVEIEYCR